MIELLIAGGVCATIIFISLFIIFGILLYDNKIAVPYTSASRVKRARDEAKIVAANVQQQRLSLLSDELSHARHEITMGRVTPELLALEASVTKKLDEIGRS